MARSTSTWGFSKRPRRNFSSKTLRSARSTSAMGTRPSSTFSIDGPTFQAAGGLALSREIRQHRDYLVCSRDVGPLRALDNALRDTRVKVRVLRIGFFVSTHARIAIQFQHQGGEHVNANGSGLGRRRSVNGPHQVEVERTANGQALRKDGRAGKHGAVRAFLVF